MDLAQLRQRYADAGLSEGDMAADPMDQFADWFAAWRGVAVGEADAMVVSSATPDGRPSVRMVLLRRFGPEGFVFFTNRDSRKGRELTANPRVALLFPWHPVGRQVIVEGAAAPSDDEASDAYWLTRPRGSQVAAAASPQSQVVPDRGALERLFDGVARRHEGEPVPRPPHWGGLRVSPDRIEFWQHRENRMHDRLVYRRDTTWSSGWRIERLAP
ncbi:MAG: pyridoxamine 5'-phosphate oxidase [Acidimicrobiales bacterium]